VYREREREKKRERERERALVCTYSIKKRAAARTET
jgi:hypothetical protein